LFNNSDWKTSGKAGGVLITVGVADGAWVGVGGTGVEVASGTDQVAVSKADSKAFVAIKLASLDEPEIPEQAASPLTIKIAVSATSRLIEWFF